MWVSLNTSTTHILVVQSRYVNMLGAHFSFCRKLNDGGCSIAIFSVSKCDVRPLPVVHISVVNLRNMALLFGIHISCIGGHNTSRRWL